MIKQLFCINKTVLRKLQCVFASLLAISFASPFASVEADEPSSIKPKLSSSTTPPSITRQAHPRGGLPAAYNLSFSANPTDQEIVNAHVFLEPLCPMNEKFEAKENQELAQALLAFKSKKDAEDVSALTAFLTTHRNSRWKPSIEVFLGERRFETGYLLEAMRLFKSSWESTKTQTDKNRKLIGDQAISDLLLLEGRLGLTEDLGKHLKEIKGRCFYGSIEAKVKDCKDAMYSQVHCPEDSFKCGPYALRSLTPLRPHVNEFKSVLSKAKSSSKGTNLSQLYDWSNQAGMQLKMAKRLSGTKLAVPSVMHWKDVGHFAAIIAEDHGKYKVVDPTFGERGNFWLSAAALNSQTDGYFLIPKETLEAGWQELTQSDGEKIWGRGGATAVDGSKLPATPSQSPTASSQASSNSNGQTCGMAVASAFSMNATLSISDTPLSYSPALGSKNMDFSCRYNYGEGHQPGTPTFTNLGADWSLNWAAYIFVDTNKNATVNSPGGGYESYANLNISISPPVYGLNYITQAHLIALNGGLSGFQRQEPDGSTQNYTFNDGGRWLMTSVVDPQGNAVTINYVAVTGGYRISTVVDAAGQSTTFNYGTTDNFKLTSIIDPSGRAAVFTYDSTLKNLISITDSVGNVSQFTYDTSTSFITEMTTPYGTTGFYAYAPLGSDEGFGPGTGIRFTLPDGTTSVVEMWIGHQRETFFWDREATAKYPNDPSNFDYSHCKTTRWMESPAPPAPSDSVGPIPLWERPPLEGPICYAYPDEFGTDPGFSAGLLNKPSQVARQLGTIIDQFQISGSINATDHLQIETNDYNLVNGGSVYDYLVKGTDTLTTIAQAFADKINADPVNVQFGVKASASTDGSGNGLLTITSLSTASMQVSCLSSGTAETISCPFKMNPFPSIAAPNYGPNPAENFALSGTAAPTDQLSITINDAGLPSGTKTINYTFSSTDTLLTALQNFASKLVADTDLQGIGLQGVWTNSLYNGRNVAPITGPALCLQTSPTSQTTYSCTGTGVTFTHADGLYGIVQATNYQYPNPTYGTSVNYFLPNPTQIIDPVGRQVNFIYPNVYNNTDVQSITVTQGSTNFTLGQWQYDNSHRPTQYTDASGQITNYSYNASEQPVSVIDALGSTSLMFYNTITPIAIGGSMGSSQTKTITINGNNASYTTSSGGTDTAEIVATNLSDKINALGLTGVSSIPVGDLIEVAAPFGTSFGATTSGSTTIASQTPVTIGATGTIGSSALERITINGNHADYTTSSSGADSPTSIASGLASAINALALTGVTATSAGSLIQITAPFGTTLADTPSGNVTIASTTTFGVGGTIPGSSTNETITVNGTNATYAAGATDTLQSIAGGLSSAITGLSISGVTSNSAGTLVKVAAPLGTTYATTGAGGITLVTGSPLSSSAFLTQAQGPLGPANLSSLTWNFSGTPSSVTNSQGYTINLAYDYMDRTTNALFPDGTFTKTIYSRLDPVMQSDRIGRWSQASFDSLDRIVSSIDPSGRQTNYCWCTCGGLRMLTDPANNKTTWTRDAEGRITAKNFADGKSVSYTYENNTSRIAKYADAMTTPQTKYFNYNLDNSQQYIRYSSSSTTSPITVAYDTTFARTTSITNGWGSYSYAYNPYPVFGTGNFAYMWIGGYPNTPSSGDIISITVRNSALPGGQHSITPYPVPSGDAGNTVQTAADLVTAINLDTTLSGNGISASSSGQLVTLTATSGVVSVVPSATGSTTATVGGAGRLAQIDNSVLTSAPVSYSYDALGRTINQMINGGKNASSWSYDAISRITSEVNPLCPAATQFDYNYVDQTPADKGDMRISQISYPSTSTHQFAKFSYQPNIGDERLSQIQNLYGTGLLSQFNYSCSAAGEISQLVKQQNAATTHQTHSYDRASQLLSCTSDTGSSFPLYISGAASAAGTATLTAYDPSLIGGQETATCTITSGDSPATIFSNLASSIGTVMGTNLGITASVIGGVPKITQSGNYATSFSATRTGNGASLSLQQSSGNFATATVSGTPRVGDAVAVTAFDTALSSGHETASYTVATGNSLSDIAAKLAGQINSDSTLAGIGVTATSNGSVVSINSQLSRATTFTAAGPANAETITIGNTGPASYAHLHKQQYYEHDCAGNITGMEGDSSGTLSGGLTTTATRLSYNNVNELIGTEAGGPIRFKATTFNPVIKAVVNSGQTVKITAPGGITLGDVLTITVHDKSLALPQSFSYTVASGDTSTTLISSHFVTANSTALSAIGITASSASNVITLVSSTSNATNYSVITSTGATENLEVGSTLGSVANISPSNAFRANPVLASGVNTESVTAVSGGGTSHTDNYAITVSSTTPQTPSYDNNGNQLSDGTNTYSWDQENRLLQITYPGSGNNTQFTYDPMGRCVKIAETGTTPPVTGNATRQFVYCGARICEERDSSGILTNSGKQFFALGQVNYSSTIPYITNHYYQKDIIGNVVGVTDSSGAPEASIQYDPFGNPTVLAGTFTPDFGFAGMYQHGRSGLNLTWFRAYSPASARWLSRDPMGEAGGTNLYAYAGNNRAPRTQEVTLIS